MAKDLGESAAVSRPAPGEPDYGWLMRWFDVHPRPTYIVARDLRLVAMNVNARKLVQDNGLMAVHGGKVTGGNRKLNDLVVSAVTVATFAEPVRRIYDSGETIYVIRASLVDETPTSLISLSLRDTSRQPVCAPLQEVFGVTKAEQRVIDQLLLGQTTEAAAEALGVSILTVRTQTKHAYAKLGVSTREELFSRLLPFLEIGSS
jgi:DNA-binding CsgD family transcriptional regulator